MTGGAIESLLARLFDALSARKRLVATAWLVRVVVAAPLSARQVERLSGGGFRSFAEPASKSF